MIGEIVVILTGVGVLVATGISAMYNGLTFGLLREAAKPAVTVYAARNDLSGVVEIRVIVYNPTSVRLQIAEVAIGGREPVDLVRFSEAAPWMRYLTAPKDKAFVASPFSGRGRSIKLDAVVPSARQRGFLFDANARKDPEAARGSADVSLAALWGLGPAPSQFPLTVRLKELSLGGRTVKVKGRVQVIR